MARRGKKRRDDGQDGQDWHRRGGPQPIKQRPETQADRDSISMRCYHCNRIFNGPFTGETVRLNSARYREIDRTNEVASNYSGGGISDRVCGRRSCIDKEAGEHVKRMQGRFPDENFDEYVNSFKNSEYEYVKDHPDEYPEGFIDDVEPPL